ncbi:ribonuclease H-like domain-containing protein, partial [Tanacetum coccineum]
TGDLYPVTAPSPIPHAFLVSQHTWHQRLGHPGGEVLRRLVSSNFILYNKEKPPVLCHACQLGKHVRLPFVSSGTVISSCFDIIHSDVWTSPIPSLSGFKYYPIHQLDVKNAFLHGDLSKTVYMHQPPGFLDSVHPDYKYALEIIDWAHMANCNPSQTPIDIESKLGSDDDLVFDPTLYRSLASSLQYLTFTRPDISYVVQQPTLSRSSVEAEYHGVANAVAETCWLRNLLRELHAPLSSATLVYCDNVSAVYLSSNPVQHQRMKHIKIDIHFVHDLVAASQVRVFHVLLRY